MKLEDKVAIVTGAGKGIGRGIAHCLAREGADVVVNAFHQESAGKVADEVKALGRKSIALAADVTNKEQVQRVVKETLDAFGKIDILVNNFGAHTDAFNTRLDPTFVDQEEIEWDEDYQFNLKSQVLMCMEVVPHLIKQESGKIINISSTAGRGTDPAQMTYGVFKAGSLHFTRTLAADLAKHNINVNDVCPGGTAHTEMGKKWALGQAESYAKAAVDRRSRCTQGSDSHGVLPEASSVQHQDARERTDTPGHPEKRKNTRGHRTCRCVFRIGGIKEHLRSVSVRGETRRVSDNRKITY